MLTDTILENPYVRLPMTFDPRNFYGSLKLVEFILKSATDTRTIAPIELLALPGMGKSTLLRYLWHPEGALQEHKDVLISPFKEEPLRIFPVLVEFRLSPLDIHPFVYLYDQFNKEYPKYKERLQSQTNFPVKLPDFPGHSKPKGPGESIDQLEKEVKRLGEIGIRIVLLLDDFDLAFQKMNYGQATRLRPLRDFVAFIMAMERPLHRVNSEAAGSPFFQNTPLIRMGGLTATEAKRLIETPAKEAGKPFPAEDVDFILEYTGFHPYLTILGGKALWEIRELMAHAQKEHNAFTKKRPELLLGQLEEDFNGPLQLYWEKLERHEQETLLMLKNDNGQQLESRHYKALRVLLEMGLVRYTLGGDYEIFSPLFKIFLENIAQTPVSSSPRRDSPHSIRPINLSGLEASLYDYLYRNAERVCTYTELWQAIWQPSTQDVDNDKQIMSMEQIRRRLQVTISRLRSKLVPMGEDISSVREQGYKFVTRTDGISV